MAKNNKGKLKASDLAAKPTPLGESEILDVKVEKLTLASSKKGLSTEVDRVLQDATLVEQTQGAMSLNLSLLDADFQALNSGVFGTRVTAALDRVSFRLEELSIVEDFRLTATMEHALIAEMREHDKPLKASRHSMTRAEFILLMLKELRTPYTFICPELHRKQPIAKRKESQAEKSAAKELTDAGRGHSLSHTGLTVKHQAMNASQAEILETALGVALGVGASDRAMTAMVVSLIQESDVSDLNKPPGELGPFSMIESTAHGIQKADGHGTINPHDVGEVAAHYITAGFTGGGGANALARAHTDWSVSKIASAVEGPKVEYPSLWNDEAKKIVEAFKGGELAGFAGEGATSAPSYSVKTSQYEYERGQPGQVEDTFTCAQRLASEVGWSFFVCGQRSIYLVNDDDLLKAAPRYKIGPNSKGLIDLKGDVPVGHRTVVIHGKRQPKPSEAELEVRIDRWGAPPGTVILLSGFGPFDGKWLVDRIERPLFDAKATVNLRAPAKPLEEPAWEVTTVDLGSAGGGEAAKGVPTGIPAPAAGAYRSPPAQGPTGVEAPRKPWNGNRITMVRWAVPMFDYAYAHGWRGPWPTSGYRPGVDPHTASGNSEHQGTQYPHGAVDFGGYGAYTERAAFFAHVDGYQGLPLIPAQFAGDGGHSSGTGH